ncbi:MAG: TolC family protein, partial [Planctomycetes bacterium]|nr:TolC family protein [Planctomycetota bacterium]
MSNRLDLQNRRDQLADAYRAVQNARNELLPNLDLTASATLPTDPDRDRAGLDFDPDEISFQAGVTFGLPLDREIERLNIRQAQINLERRRRDYDEFRDTVAINVRGAVRGIDSALFSLQIQEQGIEVAQQEKASIDAAPDRASSRDNAEAIDRLLRAQDQRDDAKRNLEVSILEYLRDTGQLRINPEGSILPLRGMEFSQKSDDQEPKTPGENAATPPPMAE